MYAPLADADISVREATMQARSYHILFKVNFLPCVLSALSACCDPVAESQGHNKRCLLASISPGSDCNHREICSRSVEADQHIRVALAQVLARLIANDMMKVKGNISHVCLRLLDPEPLVRCSLSCLFLVRNLQRLCTPCDHSKMSDGATRTHADTPGDRLGSDDCMKTHVRVLQDSSSWHAGIAARQAALQ